MNFEKLASRLGIDEDDFLELAVLYVTTTRSDLDKIKAALEENNPDPAGKAAHSIKGAAANLGFEQMAALAKTMEMAAKEGNLKGFSRYISDLEAQVEDLAALVKDHEG